MRAENASSLSLLEARARAFALAVALFTVGTGKGANTHISLAAPSRPPVSCPLHIQILDFQRMFLDELPSPLHVLAHQHGE